MLILLESMLTNVLNMNDDSKLSSMYLLMFTDMFPPTVHQLSAWLSSKLKYSYLSCEMLITEELIFEESLNCVHDN